MHNLLRTSLFVSLAVGATLAIAVVQQQNSSTHTTVYRRAAHEITKANPTVNANTLEQDLPLVDGVERKIRAHYPKTFSDENIQQITIQTWADLRKREPNGALNMTGFEQYALQSFGGLQITSQPEGAAIEVDDKPWSDTTNAQSSCRTGTRHIKLSKDGYKDAVGDAVVTEGRWTVFNRTLSKRK
jgi:hypothetical protein